LLKAEKNALGRGKGGDPHSPEKKKDGLVGPNSLSVQKKGEKNENLLEGGGESSVGILRESTGPRRERKKGTRFKEHIRTMMQEQSLGRGRKKARVLGVWEKETEEFL